MNKVFPTTPIKSSGKPHLFQTKAFELDAVDGPMPQTRFVTQKAFEKGLNPILVINKVDRPEARPHWVLDQVFELFDNLGATDEQLDFTVLQLL